MKRDLNIGIMSCFTRHIKRSRAGKKDFVGSHSVVRQNVKIVKAHSLTQTLLLKI